MKTILGRIFTTIILSGFLLITVAAQSIQDNGNLKLQRITMFYRLSPQGPLQPSFGNYFIRRDATSIVFRVELTSNQIRTLRYRLQVRQVCSVRLTQDLGLATEQEFLAATAAPEGIQLTSATRTFDLEINLHPAEGEVPHREGTHCFGDPDHLGEGPHQGVISLGQDALAGGSDMLHVLYTKGFHTVDADTLNLMRGTELVRALDQQSKRFRRRSSRRGR